MASLLTVSAKPQDISSKSGSSFINTSGIFPITIKFVSVDTTKNGATQVNFNIEYKGNTQTLWGPYIISSKGDEIKGNMALLHSLSAIIGIPEGTDLEMEEVTLKVGKDNKPKDFVIVPAFSDEEVLIRVQKEYRKYEGEIREELIIRNFFRPDGASAEEIINNAEIGKQLAIETEKYADNITYKDCTEEEVKVWIENKRAERQSGAAASAASKPASSEKATTSIFKKK